MPGKVYGVCIAGRPGTDGTGKEGLIFSRYGGILEVPRKGRPWQLQTAAGGLCGKRRAVLEGLARRFISAGSAGQAHGETRPGRPPLWRAG